MHPSTHSLKSIPTLNPKLVFAPPPSLVISMNGLGVVSKVSKLISADFY
jgi:hypothetical protein